MFWCLLLYTGTMAKVKSLRAAIYARVSQDKQSGRSVAEQEAESRAACERAGWTIAGTYRDNDVSASRFTTKARPQWLALLAELDAGHFDVLVLWEPSRGSRDLVAWSVLLDACRRHRVAVHVTSHAHTYDMANIRDWRSLADDGVDSAYESEKASQRIMRAMAANAVAGRPHGRTPYGYVRRYDPATKALVAQELDPDTSPVALDIIRRVAAGVPVSVITGDLNARGVPGPSGGPWHRQKVRTLALNRAYVGEREYAGEVHAGAWPPLVDAPTFTAARRILTDPARTTTKPGRQKYLLSHLAVCGVCGDLLTGSTRPGRAPAYWCHARSHVSASMAWIDELVEGVILARLGDDDALKARLAVSDDKAVVEAREQAVALRERLAGFRDAAAAGDLTPASLAHVEARLSVDIAAAEKKAHQASTGREVASLAAADDIPARWAVMPMPARRQVVKALFARVALGVAVGRGRHAAAEYDRVTLEWRQP